MEFDGAAGNIWAPTWFLWHDSAGSEACRQTSRKAERRIIRVHSRLEAMGIMAPLPNRMLSASYIQADHLLGFPLERVFCISIQALIKKLLCSQSSRELAGTTQVFPPLLHEWLKNCIWKPNEFIVAGFRPFIWCFFPLLSDCQHLMSSASAPLLICLNWWLNAILSHVEISLIKCTWTMFSAGRNKQI